MVHQVNISNQPEGMITLLPKSLQLCWTNVKLVTVTSVHLFIATAEALGINVNELIVNRSSIRCERLKYLKECAEKIRRDYNLAKKDALVIH